MKFFVATILISILFSCSEKPEPPSFKTPYNPLISAFTSGLISSESVIRIHLASDMEMLAETSAQLREKIFDFSPSIKGDAYIIDNRIIEFRPDERLPEGTIYNGRFLLSKLFKNKKGVQDFSFSFKTIPLNLDVVFEGLRTYNKTNFSLNEIKGRILSTDRLNVDDLEGLITALQDNRRLPVSWAIGENGKVHYFTVDSVNRVEKRSSVTIAWNGKDAGYKLAGSREYIIPGLNEFVLLDQKVIQYPEQCILLTFSDPLKTNQNLEGLIHLENFSDLRFTIEENTVKAYPVIRQEGVVNLTVEPGIQNVLGKRFSEQQVSSLKFESLKPAIRLIGRGVILPQSDGLFLPFETVNLKGVDVKIIRIYEDNISQFLQVNQLDGDYELKRAGRLVAKKSISLISERPINYGEWNTFSIDLSSLINSDPGAIYHVEMSFKRKHSLFPCPDTEEPGGEEEPSDDIINEKDMAWFDSNEYYGWEDYDYRYYDWNERNNPCSQSYYVYGNKVARNILSSNLGIMAKSGNDKSYLFAVTNLITTEPVQNVTLEIYNFQKQILASLLTDKNGTAGITLENQPYLLIAKKDKQRGYMRLDPGSSLSLSRFDVQGSGVTRGIKGFIYGERGVWRPGDTLFLNFILEDKNHQFPVNHPVSLEMFTPQGKRSAKFTSLSGINGFYSFKVPTGQDAPTGNWNARITVGNLVFNKNVRIETIKPNRLKVNLDFGTSELRSRKSSVTGRIMSSWLHGMPASGLKADVTVNFRNIPTDFNGYSDYVFTDPGRSFSPLEKQVYMGMLDQDGAATFQTSFDIKEQCPGKVNAVFTTRVFEKGGEFSTDQYAIPYSPYKQYVGLKTPAENIYGILPVDSSHVFNILTLDESGSLTSVKNLQVKIYKLDWKWWWHAGNENLASYTGSSYYSPVLEQQLNSVNGKASFRFKVNDPDWGRFYVRVYDPEGGHAAGKIMYFDSPGWSGRDGRDDPGAASMLVFNSDKNKYSPGETAVITIPAGENGRALLSIENGSRVLNHYWIKTTGGENSFSLTVTKDMSPNVYVNVTLIQPCLHKDNDLPVRLYGVIPLLVEDPESHLKPVIKMPDVLRPESLIDITVSESTGKEMTYTLALVDEGLLDITKFTTPDPWNNFYAREALGVKSFDVYDLVLGAYGGRIDGIFSIGGDTDALVVDKGSKSNRFPPVVKFLGPFHISAGKQMTHKINMPNYVGSVKAMVVAGNNGTYGNAEKSASVRNPLMILPTLPRVLGTSETIALPVTVFAMEEQVKKVNLSLEFSDVFKSDNTSQTLSFNRIGDTTVNFVLKTIEQPGKGKIRITAASGKEKSQYEIEIDIRSPNPEIINYVYGVADPGKIWNTDFLLPGMPGTNTGALEISTLPPVDIGRRLKFLMQYPHGCLEQIVSRTFPMLFIPDIMDVNETMKNTFRNNIEIAIKKMHDLQLPEGGIPFWPGATVADDWGTTFAGHFILEAKRKGYNIPDSFLKNWLRYQKNNARSWTGSSYLSEDHKYSLELAQSYRLYTLALAGEPETGAMNRLREKPGVRSMTLWRLAAAYALAGQPESARRIIDKLSIHTSEYNEPGITYGSPLRDMAMILESMLLIGEREQSVPLLQEISASLSSDTWQNTQATAFALMAVSAFAKGTKTAEEIKYEYSINNAPFKYAAAKTTYSSINYEFSGETTGNVKVANKGTGLLYVRLALYGTPAPGQEKPYSSNLVLSVNYVDLQGKPINVDKLEQGTDFLAIVSVYNPGHLGNYHNIALTQIFPSGWEIQNLRLFETQIGNYNKPDYEDIRDDRVNMYFSLDREKRKEFAVKLNAAYKGLFYLPGITCSDMYRSDVIAIKEGRWVEVVEGGRMQ